MESFDQFIAHVNQEQHRWEENQAQHRNLKRRYEQLCDHYGTHPEIDVPGFLEGGGPPAKLPRVDGHYDLVEVSNVHVKRFNVSSRRYDLHFRNVDNISDIEGTIEKVFDDVIGEIFQAPGNDRDLVGFQLDYVGLDRPILIPFMPQGEMAGWKVMSAVERVLQSYQEINIQRPVHINVVQVRNPTSSGRRVPKPNA